MPEWDGYGAVVRQRDAALTPLRGPPAALALAGRDGEGRPHRSNADGQNRDDNVDHVVGLGQETLPRMFCSYPRESDSCGRSSDL